LKYHLNLNKKIRIKKRDISIFFVLIYFSCYILFSENLFFIICNIGGNINLLIYIKMFSTCIAFYQFFQYLQIRTWILNILNIIMLDILASFASNSLFISIYMFTIYFAILNFYLTKLLTRSNKVKYMILPEDILISSVIWILKKSSKLHA